MSDTKPPPTSRYLPQQSTTTSTSGSTTAMAPPRTMKQRRVSLPGSNPMQSISARLDRVNGAGGAGAASYATGNGAEKRSHMGPPLTSWGVSFRDDSGLPPSSMAGGSPSSGFSPDPSGSSSPSGGLSSYSNSPLPPTSNNAAAASESGVYTRRRRAATVTTRTRAKDFVAPADPSPPLPVPATPTSVNASASSSSSQLTPVEVTSNGPPTSKPRKPRKRWTMEETQALVDGCNKVRGERCIIHHLPPSLSFARCL